ncbi:MAG TPA: protein translocase subunit SecD [Candidatus Azoamicus sp. OHIO2]
MISLQYRLLIIVFMFFISILYSYPNVYGETPALIIKSEKNIDKKFIDSLAYILNKKDINIKSMIIDSSNNLVITFFSTEDQFSVYELLKLKNIPVDLALNILNSNSKFFEIIKAYPMKLGLDLRGGVHFLLKVNSSNSVKEVVKTNLEIVKHKIYSNKLVCSIHQSSNGKTIKLVFNNRQECLFIKTFIKSSVIDFDILDVSDLVFKLKIKLFRELEIKQYAIEKSMNILSKRISELGLLDYIIQQSGVDKIVIELPGIQDISYAKYILGKTATIKFLLVDDSNNIDNVKNNAVRVFYTKNKTPVMLKHTDILNGSCIVSASFGFDNSLNKPCVNVKISKNASYLFKKITKENIGKLIAIVYEECVIENMTEQIQETVINIAKIMTELTDSFQITGLKLQEAKDLSLLLRSGSLPTSIFILEEKLIGPTLGEKNILTGVMFIFLSITAIFFLMIVKYKVFGLIASCSLIINFLLLIACMSIFGVIVTLPGLAGIALTLGMSIDANVLIFERIREELKVVVMINATDIGFERAFRSIFDSNMTTLIIGLVLFAFATGPIKCFALTLSMGILTSFYSSIFVTKAFIDVINKK